MDTPNPDNQQMKARAPTKPRELHIYDEGLSPKGMRKYRVEISEVFLGKHRVLRNFPAVENQLERLKLRYVREFRVPPGNVFLHEQGEAPLAG